MTESVIDFIARVLATATGFFLVEYLFTYKEYKKINELNKNTKELLEETKEERRVITESIKIWNELIRMEDEKL